MMHLPGLKALSIVACLVTAACCSDSRSRTTDRDSDGHYATTSQYRSMERKPFLASMNAALLDHDRSVKELERRAKELGTAKVETMSEHTPTLAEKREVLVNKMMAVENSLDADYEDRREEAYEAYLELREALDEATDDVLDD